MRNVEGWFVKRLPDTEVATSLRGGWPQPISECARADSEANVFAGGVGEATRMFEKSYQDGGGD